MRRETGWERWREADPNGVDEDAQIGALFRKAGKAPAISDARLRRIERQLLERRSRSWALPVMRWAVAASIILSAGALTAGVGGGARGLYKWASRLIVGAEATEEANGGRSERRSTSSHRVPAAAKVKLQPEVISEDEGDEAASDEAAINEAASAEPASDAEAGGLAAGAEAGRSARTIEGERARAAKRAHEASTGARDLGAGSRARWGRGSAPRARPVRQARAEAAPATAGDTSGDPVSVVSEDVQQEEPSRQLAEEAALLRDAITWLRRRDDPVAALRVLDDYEARFPEGKLGRDATMLRIDALLLRKRFDEALSLAEQTPSIPPSRRRELAVVAAERLAQHDCRAAVLRFSRLLDGRVVMAPPLEERSLYGRANCHIRLGEQEAAQRDFSAYLGTFPRGRFASEAKQALRSLLVQ